MGDKMYQTKEELEADFPIGTIIDCQEFTQRFYCADDVIFRKIQDYFGGDVEWVSPHHVVARKNVYTTVDGYLFDGEHWWPVSRSGMLWEIRYPEGMRF